MQLHMHTKNNIDIILYPSENVDCEYVTCYTHFTCIHDCNTYATCLYHDYLYDMHVIVMVICVSHALYAT